MLLIGYFEGIDSERGLEWRCSDSLSLREFLRLAERDGRLLVPMTDAHRAGTFLLITRRHGHAHRYAARNVCHVGIIDCIGGRDRDAEKKWFFAVWHG